MSNYRCSICGCLASTPQLHVCGGSVPSSNLPNAPSRAALAERLTDWERYARQHDSSAGHNWVGLADTLAMARSALLREQERQGYGGRRCVCCDELARHGMLTCHEHREKESDATAALLREAEPSNNGMSRSDRECGAVPTPTRAALAERLLEMSCRGGYSQRDVDDLEDAAAALLREPEENWLAALRALADIPCDERERTGGAPGDDQYSCYSECVTSRARRALESLTPQPTDEDVARELVFLWHCVAGAERRTLAMALDWLAP